MRVDFAFNLQLVQLFANFTFEHEKRPCKECKTEDAKRRLQKRVRKIVDKHFAFAVMI
jgi:hypothetical protein